MLLMTVFAIAFAVALVVGFLQASLTDLKIARNTQYSKRALYIADAGIEDAVSELRWLRFWSDGFADKPFAGDSYTVTVANTYPTAVIDSIGTVSGGFQKHARAGVTILGPPYHKPYPVIVDYWNELF